MTPTNTPDTAPRKRRRVVRRKTIAPTRYATPPEPGLTAKEYLALALNDTSRTHKSNAELAAVFKGRKPTETDYRIDLRIRISRLRDKVKALDEGFPFE